MPATLPTPDALTRETDTIQRKLDELRAIQGRSRNIVVLLAVVLTAMSIGFVLVTYNRINANFNETAMQQALSEGAPRLLPDVAARLFKSSYSLMPEYRAKALQRLQVAGPEVATAARKRLMELPSELATELMPKVQKTVDDVVAKVTPDLTAQFATLADDKKAAILADFHAKLTKQVSDRATAIVDAQTAELNQTLTKFDVSDDKVNQDPSVLERNFVHSLIMLMDHEITSDDPITATTAPVTGLH